MAKRIIWTFRAYEEKIAILHYWNTQSQSKIYSRKLNLLFKKAIDSINKMPHIGRLTNIKGVRVKLLKEYLIFYEEKESIIYILSIWDGRRDPKEAPYK